MILKRICILPLKRFMQDVWFRTRISLSFGFLFNLVYIGMKLFSGLYYHSVWFISLAFYYTLLAMMRYLLLRRNRGKKGRTPLEEELYRYRLCGIILLVMNQALAGIVALMVQQDDGFVYPGVLIYVMAAYSFYLVIAAVVHMIRYRKRGSPVLSAAHVINLVAAMVSILSLETAMLARVGDGARDNVFRRVMTGTTGGGVCIAVIGMAIFMIWKSSRQLKKLRA